MGVFLSGSLVEAEGAPSRWEHLAAPPPGIDYIVLKTDPVAKPDPAPLQFTGTLDPPTLLLNGDPLALSAVEVPFYARRPGPGIWINQDAIRTQGEMGRFFHEYVQKSSSGATALDILIRTSKGRAFQTVLPLDRCFLDLPFQVRIVADAKNPRTSYEFVLRGPRPPGAKLEIVDAREVSYAAGDRDVSVRLELPVGKGRISGRMSQPRGSNRILDVPVEVSRVSFDPGAASLSLRVPEGQSPGGKWRGQWGVPLRIVGITDPRARILIQSEEVDVDRAGNFEAEFYPTREKEEIRFQVLPPSGVPFEHVKEVTCSDCEEKLSSGERFPSLRLKRSSYLLSVGLLQSNWLSPRSGTVQAEFERMGASARNQPVGFPISLTAEIALGWSDALMLSAERLPPTKDVRSGRTLNLSKSYLVSAYYWREFSPDPRWSLSGGGGAGWFRTEVSSTGFSPSPDGLNQNLGLGVGGGAGYRMNRLLELGARFKWMPSQLMVGLSGSPARFHVLSVNWVELRFHL